MCDENCQLKKGKNGRKLLRLKTKRSQTENEGAPAAKQTRGELHACQTQISRYPEDYQVRLQITFSINNGTYCGIGRYTLKHNNCMNDPLRQKKLIKNQIKWSKLTYDNTFTNKKPRKN